jgi:hypothetical protein
MPRNELFGWTWILLGMVAGMALGLRFHREDWLGGYASHPRRLLRLGHVSFFGLGFVNVLFALTAPQLRLGPGVLALAAWSLVVGGVTMPICCALMAWRKAFQPLFGLPVTTLLLGAAITVVGMLRP